MAATRVTPHNLDAEASVLGGIFLRNEVLSQLDTLEVEDFYSPKHQAVFQAMRNLEATAKPIDPITALAELDRMGKAEAIGGLGFLSELTLRVPSAENVIHYAEIVTDKRAAAKVIRAASEILEQGFEDDQEVRDYLDMAEAKIFEVTQRREKSGPEPIKSLIKKVFGSLDERFASPDGVTGVPTGFADLDQKTAGLQPTELIILAARPAMGKTSFAMSLAQNAAISGGWPVIVFSLEMSSTQLAERLLCSEARVDSSALRRGQLQRQDMTNLTYAANTLSKAPILIDDTPALSLRELRARARRFRSSKELFDGPNGKKKTGLIVIDYLQLMRGSPQAAKASREQEISEISRGLKSLAKELGCPVLALSQLNRSLESRTDKRPQLSDLRECVTGDTLVVLADGRRLPIADLVGTTPTVVAMTADGKLTTAASDAVWPVGRRPVFDLRLASGRALRATGLHRLYGPNGWTRVADLAVGDRLATARTLPPPSAPLAWPDDRAANTNVDTLPPTAFARVKATMRQRGVSQRAMAEMRGTSYGGNAHFAFAPSREVVAEYAELLDDDVLRAQAESDLFWDRLVSIEPAGEEEVYDLTVPGPASWLADGVVSHNSGAIEQDADVILFIYRDVVYNKDTEVPNVAEVIIGKNRHGATGTVETHFEGRFTRFENLSQRGDGPPQ